ncbi:hypothetical protein [Endozoicomonas euniceicola]|uniref:C2H2-type domain-containing protein n=1 Tax=Endozoicomonas euniceicola TaxID=1234143 RepID=A0ABY6GPZ6_9GAMM|nr:hypothetical protein [Endozoicomonas euniceicola]UYM14827.1 hypothetical protein NX720_18320 [Endozoicomonas euniceicola]
MPVIDIAPLQETPTETADTSGYSGSDSPPDDKPHRPSGLWETMTTVVKSISWRPVYATREIIGYTLTLTLRKQEGSLKPMTYSWMPMVATVVVDWLISTHWNPVQLLFTQMHQQEINQQHQLAIITLGKDGEGGSTTQGISGNNEGCSSSSASLQLYTQHLSVNNCQINGGFGGGEPPPLIPHSASRTSYCEACRHKPCYHLSTSHAHSTSQTADLRPGGRRQPVCIKHLLCTGKSCKYPAAEVRDENIPNSSHRQKVGEPPEKKHKTSPAVEYDSACRTLIQCHSSSTAPATPDSLRCTRMMTALEEQSKNHEPQRLTCNTKVVGKDGQQQPCGRSFKNERSLLTHKSQYHGGQKTCDMKVKDKDGQQRVCGEIFESSRVLWSHKKRDHTEQQTCMTTVVEENGQQRPCGKVYKNALALSDHQRAHKKKKHDKNGQD